MNLDKDPTKKSPSFGTNERVYAINSSWTNADEEIVVPDFQTMVSDITMPKHSKTRSGSYLRRSNQGTKHKLLDREDIEKEIDAQGVVEYDGPSIPIKGKVLLGPISQYTLFNKFPTTFIVHILIVLLDSWLLLNTINDTNTFSREMQLFLYTKFLDPAIEVNDIVIDRERTFYKISDLQQQVNSSL